MQDIIISENIYNKQEIEVSLGRISSSININPRKTLNMENVDNLLEAEGAFPAIHLGLLKEELIIIDGYHRFTAEQKRKAGSIRAFVTEYNTILEAKRDAFKENASHGIKLTEFDIAMWIYNNYIETIKETPTASLIGFINDVKYNERRGRGLFAWALIHKEILNDNIVEIKRIGSCEDLYSLINFYKEVPGSISEDFKIKFKNFYDTYALTLDSLELRKAISLFKEDKDYFAEKRKEQEALEEQEKMERMNAMDSVERIDPSDEIDRSANVDYSETEDEDIKDFNEKIKELKEFSEEKEEVHNVEEVKPRKQKITKNLQDVSNVLTSIVLLQSQDKIEIGKDEVAIMRNIQDCISSIIADSGVEEEKI